MDNASHQGRLRFHLGNAAWTDFGLDGANCDAKKPVCDPSVVSDDWVTKGFHIHINGVELALRPDHKGQLGFDAVFGSIEDAPVCAAIRFATDNCLPNDTVRGRWLRAIDRAMLFMIGYSGVLRPLANGRMVEFKFLKLAIQRYESWHVNP
jgi:hypothetical protein